MNLSCTRPLGDATTILDICDRDEQDDYLFPLTTNKTWFTNDFERRVLPFSPIVQEFPFRGDATFGSHFQFEVGSVKACDLLLGVMLQVRLRHWLPEWIRDLLKSGQIVYKDASDAWFYANSMGTILVKETELCLEDHTIEKFGSDFTQVFTNVFPDMNTQFGIATDALGQVSLPRLKNWDPRRSFPTEKGWISCILPFSFQREKMRSSFPLVSVKEGGVRIRFKLRPFHECVRSARGVRQSIYETPLGKTFTFTDLRGGENPPEFSYTVPQNTSLQFDSVRLVTYGVVVDGEFRKALMHKPFDRLYRDVQTFVFDEPKKYVLIPGENNQIHVQVPLECNGPIEEILWIVRRKGVETNNEWVNYSSVLESEYDPVFNPLDSLLVATAIQIDGKTIVDEKEDYFRHCLAKAHKGGIVGYRRFIYGYSFAKNPGEHNPSGWFNSSRTTDVRARFTIQPPGGIGDVDWEIVVFAIGMNWVRFESGIANRVYNS
jgi:hypothetical protein